MTEDRAQYDPEEWGCTPDEPCTHRHPSDDELERVATIAAAVHGALTDVYQANRSLGIMERALNDPRGRGLVGVLGIDGTAESALAEVRDYLNHQLFEAARLSRHFAEVYEAAYGVDPETGVLLEVDA